MTSLAVDRWINIISAGTAGQPFWSGWSRQKIVHVIENMTDPTRPMTFKQARAALYATPPYKLEMKTGYRVAGVACWAEGSFIMTRYCMGVQLTWWGSVRCFFSDLYTYPAPWPGWVVLTDDETGFAVAEHNRRR